MRNSTPCVYQRVAGAIRSGPWASWIAAIAVAVASTQWSHQASAGDPPQAPAPSAQSSSADAAKTAPAPAKRPLDLAAPPINRVLTPEQVRDFVTEPEDDGTEPADVTVASPHYLDPIPNGAFGALPWALLHPLQAWRIFTPITDE